MKRPGLKSAIIGCLRTRVRKQPIIALYFESETVLQFCNLEALVHIKHMRVSEMLFRGV